MLIEITDMMISLIKTMSVLMVLAYILTQTRLYDEILEQRLKGHNQVLLAIIFGLFSIFGTLSGIEFLGAIANIRDLGPAIAGVIGGMPMGLGAGLIGGLHRLSLGGITAIPCSISTMLAGLTGGAIHRHRKGKFIGMWGAVIFAFLMECFHMLLTLMLGRPFDMALAVVQQVSAPMIIANSLGLGIFSFIFANVARERETAAAKKKMESELQIAREIQMSILPRVFPPFPERDEFDLYAVLVSAREVGGDLFDFYFPYEDKLYFTVGDVSGKGVPASLLMAVTKTLLKAKATLGLPLHEVLFRVNNELCCGNDSMMFVTLFQGNMDVRTGVVEYCNGGHNPPFIIRVDGTVEQLDCIGDMALGVMEDMQYHLRKVQLGCGDKIVIFTDGVTEAQNLNNDLFTDERLGDFLQRNHFLPTQKLVEALLNEIDIFADGMEQADDITIMAIQFALGKENMKIILKNNISELVNLDRAIEEYALNNGIDNTTALSINLALEELVTNIINYGYGDDSNKGDIEINLDLKGNLLRIVIADNGDCFNPLKLPEPNIIGTAEERCVGGLGVHIVRSVMDQLEYRRVGNSNILGIFKCVKGTGLVTHPF